MPSEQAVRSLEIARLQEEPPRQLPNGGLSPHAGSDTSGESGTTVDDLDALPPEDMDEDLFGMTKCSLIRDLYFIARQKREGNSGFHRYIRLVSTLSVLFLCIAIQVTLLTKVKMFVSSKLVHDIRLSYDKFEKHMYSEHYMSKNGYHRGVAGTFHPTRFANLTLDEQNAICKVSLSQADFFFCVLFVWTMTCLREVKRACNDFLSFVWHTETCDTMLKSFEHLDTLDPELGRSVEDPGCVVITRLTRSVKILFVLFIVLPRLGITFYLIWLGCRWLLATADFQELLINACALELVLNLKEIMYMTLIPERNKADCANTKVLPRSRRAKEKEGFLVFTDSLGWGFIATLWVFLYMGIPGHWSGVQQVLPDYKWDVKQVCVPFIQWRYCVDPPCPESMF